MGKGEGGALVKKKLKNLFLFITQNPSDLKILKFILEEGF